MDFPQARQGHKTRPTPQREPWFLASKQLYVEAIAQFQRDATWTFMGWEEGYIQNQGNPQYRSRWAAPPNLGSHTSLSTYLLMPTEATSICLEGRPACMLAGFKLDSKGKPTKLVSFSDTLFLPVLLPVLAGSRNLLSLHLDIGLQGCEQVDTHLPVVIDFGAL